jgi:hypothetical protein
MRGELLKYTLMSIALVLALFITMPFTAEPAEAG